MNSIQQFFETLSSSIADKTFAKLSFGDYRGEEPQLKKLIVKQVIIKKKEHLSFTYRYQTRDITKNYLVITAINELEKLFGENEFRYAHLCTTTSDFKLQRNKKGGFNLKTEPPTIKEAPSLTHDKQKNRKINPSADNYLHALGITDNNGKVRKTGQDKYRQINHYIEILSSLLKDLPQDKKLHIADMGSGKGYLTFALYDYLRNNLKLNTQVTGVEFREDLVTLCNDIAKQSKFEGLDFVEGTIENYKPTNELDVLIALHACDTATDDAIYKGITNKAELIVVAPCCHKQIRREMQKGKAENETKFLTKHGIFMERQAEMVTDGLRALYLELSGYSTRVFEFISTEHTPKNVLIVAQKRKKVLDNKTELLQKIANSKKFFGIEMHYLETLLNIL